MFLLKRCSDRVTLQWQSLLDGIRLYAMKFRRKLINKIPPGIRPFLRHIYERLPRKGGRAARRVREQRYRMLNLGYLDRGYRELANWAETSRNKDMRRLACWELVSWHVGQNSPEDARIILHYTSKLQDLEWRPKRLVYLAIARSMALYTLGNPVEALRILEGGPFWQADPDLILGRASFDNDVENRLEALNRIFRQEGLSEVKLLPGCKTAFDRLAATTVERAPDRIERPLISVIVPAYNAQSTIATAIRSLQEQTWRNIEILVIDDCSNDNTVSIASAMAETDPRIRVFRMEQNSGAYCARNLGLKVARGKYVTCHDSDDWSHPAKLQIQAEDLEARGERTIANYSYLYFVDEELRARVRRLGSYLRLNTSSLMFRRDPVVAKLGAWDEVRFAADSELLERLYAVFGRASVTSIAKPLALVRYREDSLTASTAFGYHGFRMGARQFYRERYLQFHRSTQALRLNGNQQRRPFYVPEPMLPTRVPGDARRYFDVVLTLDCRRGGIDLKRAIAAIQNYRRLAASIAVFHLPSFEGDPERPIHKAFTKLLDVGLLHYVVPGERIACDKLHILKWPLLLDYNRFFVDVQTKTIEVTTNDTSLLGRAAEPSAEERQQCESNLHRYCDAPVVWCTSP